VNGTIFQAGSTAIWSTAASGIWDVDAIWNRQTALCCNSFLAGDVHYDINNLGFQIMSSAQTSLLTMDVYRRAGDNFSASGWNNITRANGTRMTNIVVVSSGASLGPRTHLTVRGNGNMHLSIRGRLTGLGQNGQDVAPTANWHFAEIEMHTNPNAYGTGVTDATRRLRAQHTFTHEVGHALKLNDITNANCVTVMRQGNPVGNTSLTVTNHDRNALRYKWGQ